jgi:WD40 repeat protein
LARWGKGTITALDISRDGHWLAVGSARGTYLYDLNTLEEHLFLPLTTPERAHTEQEIVLMETESVSAVAFAPDGETVATASAGAIRTHVWDVMSGEEVLFLGAPIPNSLAFSPDGKTLFIGETPGTYVTAWDLSSKEHRSLVWEGLEYEVNLLAVSPDGRWVAAANTAYASGAALWEWPGGTLQTVVPCGGDFPEMQFPMDLAASADGACLALLCDSSAVLWDVENQVAHDIALTGYPLSIALDHGQPPRMYIGTIDGLVEVWDPIRGVQLDTWGAPGDEPPFGPLRDVEYLAVYPLPDGGEGLAAASEARVAFWDTQSGALLNLLAAHLSPFAALSLSPDGRWLALGDDAGRLHLWDAQTGDPLWTSDAHRSVVQALAFSPEGQLLASGGDDGALYLWDATKGQVQATLIEPYAPESLSLASVEAVAFSPNGRWLASAVYDSDRIVLWDPQTGRQVRLLPGLEGTEAIAFSPDGRLLALANEEGTIKIVDPNTGEEVAHWNNEVGFSVTSLAFSPDGSTLAVNDVSGIVTLRDSTTGQVLQTLDAFSTQVVYLSPELLLTASGDLQVWRVPEGERLSGIQANLFGAPAVSPDGRLLYLAGRDGVVRVFGIRP